jgi:hypothetical protein
MEMEGFIGGQGNDYHTWHNYMADYINDNNARVIKYDAMPETIIEGIKNIIATEFGTDVPTPELLGAQKKAGGKRGRTTFSIFNPEMFERWNNDTLKESIANKTTYKSNRRSSIRFVDTAISEAGLGYFFIQEGKDKGKLKPASIDKYDPKDVKKLRTVIIESLKERGGGAKSAATHVYQWLEFITPSSFRDEWDWASQKKDAYAAVSPPKQAEGEKIPPYKIAPPKVRGTLIGFLLEKNYLTDAIKTHRKLAGSDIQGQVAIKAAAQANFKKSRGRLALALGFIPGMRGIDIPYLEHQSISSDGAEITLYYAKQQPYVAQIPPRYRRLIVQLHKEYIESYKLLMETNPGLFAKENIHEHIKTTKVEGLGMVPGLLFINITQDGTKIEKTHAGAPITAKASIRPRSVQTALGETRYVSYTNALFREDLLGALGQVIKSLSGKEAKEASAWYEEWDKNVITGDKTHLGRQSAIQMAYTIGMEPDLIRLMVGHQKTNPKYAQNTEVRIGEIDTAITDIIGDETLIVEELDGELTRVALELLEKRHPHVATMVTETKIKSAKKPFIGLTFERANYSNSGNVNLGIIYSSKDKDYIFAIKVGAGKNAVYYRVNDSDIEQVSIEPWIASKVINTIRQTTLLKDSEYTNRIAEIADKELKRAVKEGPKALLSIVTTESLASRGAFTKVTFERAKNSWVKKIVNRLGLGTPYEMHFSEERNEVDPNSELGERILREHGYNKEKRDAFKKSGRKILITGSQEVVLDHRGRKRVVYRFWYGANEETVLHEIFHTVVAEGGKIKGITDKMNIDSIIDQEVAADLFAKRMMKGLRFKDGQITGKMNMTGFIKGGGQVLRVGPRLYTIAQIDQVELLHPKIVAMSKKNRGKTTANELIEGLNKAIGDPDEFIRNLNDAILKEEDIRARNARMVAKLGRKWWRIRKFFEFFLGLEIYTHNRFIKMARLMHRGGIARSEIFIKEFQKRAKGLTDNGHRAFFDYADGQLNDAEIKLFMQALEKRNRDFMEKFDEQDKMNNEILRSEEIIELMKEQGLSEDSPQVYRRKTLIKKKKEEIKKLGLENVTVMEAGNEHDAIVLKNPTRKEFKNEIEKIQNTVEKAFWVDDKRALEDAVKNGLPREFMKLARETKELNIKLADLLLNGKHISEETYWRFYGGYVHQMYLLNLVKEHTEGMGYDPAALTVGTKEGYLAERSNKTETEQLSMGLIKNMNTVQTVAIGQTLATLANADWYKRLKNPKVGAVIPFDTIKNVEKGKEGYVMRLEMDEKYHRTYISFLGETKGGSMTVTTIKANKHIFSYKPHELAQAIVDTKAMIEKAKRIGTFNASDIAIMEKLLQQMDELYAPVDEYLKKGGENLDLIKDFRLMGANYGELTGEYLAKGIRDDMVPLEEDTASKGEVFKFLIRWNAQFTMMFKAGKVALNPPTMARNIVSNLLQNNMRGRPLTHIPLDFFKAISSYATRDEYYMMALETGLFKGNLMQTEAQELLKDMKASNAHKSFFKFSAFIASKAKYYGIIDEVAKLSIFRQLMTEGPLNRFGFGTGKGKINRYDAALEAAKWGMDYSQADRSIKNLRKWIMPFVTYQYKIAPLIVESLARRPWVLGKWAAFFGVSALSIPSIAGEISKALLGMSDEEWDKLLKQLPDFITKNSTFVPIPIRSKEGKVMWFDLMYFMPFGTWFSALKGLSEREIAEVYREMGISNPFLTVMYAAASASSGKPAKDPFTHQEIYNDVDTPLVKFHKWFSWTHNVVTPSWMQNITYARGQKKGPLPLMIDNFVHKYKKKEWRDNWGRLMGNEQLWRWLGVNPYIFSARQSYAIKKAKLAHLQKQYYKKIRGYDYKEDKEKMKKITKYYHKLRKGIIEPKPGATEILDVFR